jgi:predicted TIM-barrel fold metal-dependent hydrolase
MNDPAMIALFEFVESADRLIMIGPEETAPPETPSLKTLLKELDTVLERFPGLHVQLNHAGCFDPLGPDGHVAIQLAARHTNLYLSTAILGYCFDDGHEYPFPKQLARLRKLYEGVGADRLMFATDWPWCEHVRKYVQDVEAVRRHYDFMTKEEKEKFLGLNAIRYLGRHAKKRASKSASVAAGWAQGSEQTA